MVREDYCRREQKEKKRKTFKRRDKKKRRNKGAFTVGVLFLGV
jgi:hypothetical protein